MNHTKSSREWVCPLPAECDKLQQAIGAIKSQPVKYPQLQQRRAEFVGRVRDMQDGSDTSMAAQLVDSGHGSAGIM